MCRMPSSGSWYCSFYHIKNQRKDETTGQNQILKSEQDIINRIVKLETKSRIAFERYINLTKETQPVSANVEWTYHLTLRAAIESLEWVLRDN